MEGPSFLRNKPSFFKVLMGDFTSQLKIPSAFVKNLGGLEGVFPKKYSISNSKGRCWSVEINRLSRRLIFQNGWKEFVEDNSLEMGDFLVFRCWGSLELLVHMYGKNCCEKEVGFTHDTRGVRETNFQRCEVIDVDAEPNATDAGCVKQNNEAENTDIGLAIKRQNLKVPRQNQKCINVAAAAKNFALKYPQFRVVMRRAYISNRHFNVPCCLRKCIKNHRIIKLESSNKTWTAKFIVYRKSCRLSNVDQFLRDNNLKVGDICIFEIINRQDVTFKVTIFR